MLEKTNKDFLNTWKDFPGPKFLKFGFVIIGFLCWVEFFYPDFKFASHYLYLLFGSGNALLGVIAFSAGAGCLACGLLWFPSYVWSFFRG